VVESKAKVVAVSENLQGQKYRLGAKLYRVRNWYWSNL